MFVELFFIKKYIFIFGDPVISFTVVLTGILVFSGFGGYCSQRIGPNGLRYVLIALILVLMFVFFGLDPIVHRILACSKNYTLHLGLPASHTIRLPCWVFPSLWACGYLLNHPAQRAYAWTTNGCASVLASIASAQIALSIGIPTIILCAAAAYFLAFLINNTKINRHK